MVSHETGFPPKATTMALMRPICGWPAGWNAYTNSQMTEAPTSEIASGRNTMVLASDSRRIRSNSPAKRSPSSTLAPVPKMSQMTLLRRTVTNSGSVMTAKLSSVSWPASLVKLR